MYIYIQYISGASPKLLFQGKVHLYSHYPCSSLVNPARQPLAWASS